MFLLLVASVSRSAAQVTGSGSGSGSGSPLFNNSGDISVLIDEYSPQGEYIITMRHNV